MDEPLRSLDAATTDATLDLIRQFKADGGLAVMASHLGSTLDVLADDHLVMGTPEETDARAEATGAAK
jgi:ABC-2 type transport system ATP-binding protein